MNDLEHCTAEVLEMAKEQFEHDGDLEPIFFVITKVGEPATLPTKGFAPLMDIGPAKDAIFGALREFVKVTKPRVVVIATAARMAFVRGEKDKTDDEEWNRVKKEGFPRDKVTHEDTIVVSAQSPDGAMITVVPFHNEHGIPIYGEPMVHRMGIDEFRGRQKMFGDLRKEYLG